MNSAKQIAARFLGDLSGYSPGHLEFEAHVDILRQLLEQAEARGVQARPVEARVSPWDVLDPAEATGDVTDAEIAAVEQLALDALAAIRTAGGSTAPIVRWFQWKDNRGVAVFLELLRRVKAAEGSARMAKHQELAARASLEELESRTIDLELQLRQAYTATDIHGLIEQAASGHDKLALDHRNTTAQIKAEALRRWAETFVPLAPAPARSAEQT